MAAVRISSRKLWEVLRQIGVEPWWRHPFKREEVIVTPQKIEAVVELKLLRERGIHRFNGVKNGFVLLGSVSIARLTGISITWLKQQPDFPLHERLTLSEWLKILPPILERHRNGYRAIMELEKLKAEVILRANEIFQSLQSISENGDAVEGDAGTGAGSVGSSVSVQVW